MSYPGAKAGSGVYQTLINQMPPHRVYVEPFLGSGAVMRRKRPAAMNIGCDLAAEVVALSADHVERGDWVLRGAAADSAENGDGISQFMFFCRDGIGYLRLACPLRDALVYCDPPYLWSTRRQHRRMYRYEMSRYQHAELVDVCRRLPCKVMVSGYRSELYDRALSGWRRVEFTVRTHAGPATECLWMNYPEPDALHDYRYLGRNFRERERIRRRQARWRRRLLAMPALERLAMQAALAGPEVKAEIGR